MTFGIEQDRAILAGCRREPERCPPAAERLLAIVDAARLKHGRARLGEVNRSLNLAITYRSDAVRHGTPDAWSSPLATLSSGAGDCEDYAFAKYLALSEAGMAPTDLRFVIVRDTRLRQDHAVLAARLDDRWLVLDNRTLLLVDDHDARDYVGVTSFALQDQTFVIAADHRESMRDGIPPLVEDAAHPRPGRS
jgi:predicted transglutaminase-like cysteine proteinase